MAKAGALGEQTQWKGGEVSLTLVILLLMLVFLLCLSSFFSGTETAFFSLSNFQISKIEESGNANGGVVSDLMKRSDLLLNGILFGNLIVNVLLAAAAALLSHLLLTSRGLSENLVFLLDIIGVSLFLLILGEVTPKVYAIENAEKLAPRLAPLMRWWIFMLKPVLKAMTAFSNFFSRIFSSKNQSQAYTPEELRALFDTPEMEEEIESETRDMISSIFDFGETRVKEIMVPRIDIVSADIETNLEEFLKLVRESEFSRIPAYSENIDQIVGIVYSKDLLKYVSVEKKTEERILPLLKEAFFVPETKMISDLLKELQRDRIHMAIVVDEYGGTAGLVTLEDILEEIVGEIRDEYDAEEKMFRKLDENAYLVNGKLDIDDLSDLLGTEMVGEGFETVGGLIYQALGRIPHQGEEVVVDDVRFIVSKVIGRRIVRVKVIRVHEDRASGEIK